MALTWGEEWLLREAIQVDGKEAGVGAIAARVESILAWAFEALVELITKFMLWLVWLPWSVVAERALPGLWMELWNLLFNGKTQLASMKRPAFFISMDQRAGVLLPILKNKLKASYWNSEMRKGFFFTDDRAGELSVCWDVLQKYQAITQYSESPRGVYYGFWNPITRRRKGFLKVLQTSVLPRTTTTNLCSSGKIVT